MRLRNFIIALLSVAIFAIWPILGRAQSGLEFSEVSVSLWPEYDQPSMLVIYRISLAPQITLPASVEVRLPASARINAVASKQPAGDLLNLAHDENTQMGWKLVTLTATTPDLQIEYYDDLVRDGQTRTYQYTWPGLVAVGRFLIEVQQPLGATNLIISPSMGMGAPAAGGLTYYTADQGALAVGQTFTISMQYTNSADILTAGESTVEPSAPIEEAAGRSNPMAALPYLLGVAGLALIAVSAYWYFVRTGTQGTAPVRNRYHNRSKASGVRKQSVGANKKDNVDGAEPRYCHQCGHRAHENDRFCRACGTVLRRE